MDRDFASQAWAQNHDQLAASIFRAIEKLRYGFSRLQAIRFNAPWKRVRN